ncbi:hypothetical protein [Empedobacter brevis]|uniref:hypothetical protein n=1 Tax=Empedobacter brevis TaxID=247 RepID=UPI0028AB4D10|nr:hypothetical protein [Empedobacter brevis]
MLNNSKKIDLIHFHEYQLNTLTLLNIINEKQSTFLHLNDEFDSDFRPKGIDLYSVHEIKKREEIAREHYYEVYALTEILKERLNNFYNIASEAVQNEIEEFTKDYGKTMKKINN